MQMEAIASAIMTLNTIAMPAATSITLCLPSDDPAPDKVSNWLPTTAGADFLRGPLDLPTIARALQGKPGDGLPDGNEEVR
jgi:hypothetical protein